MRTSGVDPVMAELAATALTVSPVDRRTSWPLRKSVANDVERNPGIVEMREVRVLRHQVAQPLWGAQRLARSYERTQVLDRLQWEDVVPARSPPDVRQSLQRRWGHMPGSRSRGHLNGDRSGSETVHTLRSLRAWQRRR